MLLFGGDHAGIVETLTHDLAPHILVVTMLA
jgi:hypothetical protein